MDEELRRYLEAMEARLMGRMNDGFEHVLSQLQFLRRETKGHVLFGMYEHLTLSQRVAALEEELRRGRGEG